MVSKKLFLSASPIARQVVAIWLLRLLVPDWAPSLSPQYLQTAFQTSSNTFEVAHQILLKELTYLWSPNTWLRWIMLIIGSRAINCVGCACRHFWGSSQWICTWEAIYKISSSTQIKYDSFDRRNIKQPVELNAYFCVLASYPRIYELARPSKIDGGRISTRPAISTAGS